MGGLCAGDTCDECYGSGELECEWKSDKITFGGDMKETSKCVNGDIKCESSVSGPYPSGEVCGNCNGSGKIRCPKCSGKGKSK